MGMFIRFQGGIQLYLQIYIAFLSEAKQSPIWCDLAGVDGHR